MKQINSDQIKGYLAGLYVCSDKLRGIDHLEYKMFTNDFLSDSCAFAAIFLIGASIEQNSEIQKKEIENWRIDFNEKRPHSSLGNKTPLEFAMESEKMVSA